MVYAGRGGKKDPSPEKKKRIKRRKRNWKGEKKIKGEKKEKREKKEKKISEKGENIRKFYKISTFYRAIFQNIFLNKKPEEIVLKSILKSHENSLIPKCFQ